MTEAKNGITYADAGVDIDAGNALVERIKPAAKRTNRPGTLSGLGGFGALAGFFHPACQRFHLGGVHFHFAAGCVDADCAGGRHVTGHAHHRAA